MDSFGAYRSEFTNKGFELFLNALSEKSQLFLPHFEKNLLFLDGHSPFLLEDLKTFKFTMNSYFWYLTLVVNDQTYFTTTRWSEWFRSSKEAELFCEILNDLFLDIPF